MGSRRRRLHRGDVRSLVGLGVAVCAAVAGCGGASDPGSPQDRRIPTSAVLDDAPKDRCVVRLHGKGGTGAETVLDDGVSIISPDGNSSGWEGRQWLYFPEEAYESARDVVAGAVAGCRQVIVHGFSNGGAFAAKLWCRGETFGGSVVGVVVDDPVVDGAVEGCTPDRAVDLALYWTGALDPPATAGWRCEEQDWTCEGGRTIGIGAFSAAMGTSVRSSPRDDHEWYEDAPELSAWR